ncbi:MAG: hypothetical protein B6243_12040 [Anaerolineaceae bacterium 4572_5.2]|nr:MAG: hypothetical protein B6243_12040 [Anaerolineaceae bacterium 4572_5.2]
MLRKVCLIVGLVAVLSFGVVGAASADTISGRGWLKAVGYGVAKLDMTGDVKITGHGAGVITIQGAKTVRVEGKGVRSEQADGTVVLRGVKGRVFIRGKDMTVKMAGGKIDFIARGSGSVFLEGRGAYHTRHYRGVWAEEGVELPMIE